MKPQSSLEQMRDCDILSIVHLCKGDEKVRVIIIKTFEELTSEGLAVIVCGRVELGGALGVQLAARDARGADPA